MSTIAGPLAELADAVTEVPLVDGTSTRFVNFDYAASAPPLASVHRVVTTAMAHYASIHRGQSYLSRVSTAAYERARDTVAALTGAQRDGDVVDLHAQHHRCSEPARQRRTGTDRAPRHRASRQPAALAQPADIRR